ncbi:mannuronan synthase [Aureimonas endophytica]|uniref:Mannuronan synthase n=1 Tax=Aureimonas endophytica TaxID=2027858 RepID=A0A917A365_9HYPH|nr:glycosyltransferase [Aureimonas endophytica]GGE22880.1 mannuronan synthase [Aureimonas endophytica]
MRVASLPAFVERSGRTAALLGWLLYAGLLVGLFALLPPELPRLEAASAILSFGLVGFWRWAWGAMHLTRSAIYSRLVFPKIRARAEAAAPPPALYVLVTSYRMPQALNAAVYGRLFDEIARFGVPTMVVACVTDHADVLTIERSFARRDLPEGSRVEIISQRGKGKRDAMAAALDLMAADHPPAGAQVVLMDGDTLLGEDALRKTCAVLTAEPRVGAVTTDNLPIVKGGGFTREWYRARMMQRDNLMGSMALSRRLLVLTGRFSVFRARLATSNGFVNAVAGDHVDHPRLGRIRMLTGDDKSTWFETLRTGWDMLYVRDVAVHPVEELPAGGFVRASSALMLRWYGNMVRSNGRAVALGPKRCGWFLWIALLDQRLSMWTSLLGPTTAILLALTQDATVLTLYLVWVLLSRGVLCALYGLTTGRFHPLFVFALYYNQVVGAAIKIFAYHHPDRQRWTRQAKTSGGPLTRPSFGARLSGPYLVTSISLFMLATATLSGSLDAAPSARHPWSLGDALFTPVRHPSVHGPGS